MEVGRTLTEKYDVTARLAHYLGFQKNEEADSETAMPLGRWGSGRLLDSVPVGERQRSVASGSRVGHPWGSDLPDPLKKKIRPAGRSAVVASPPVGSE